MVFRVVAKLGDLGVVAPIRTDTAVDLEVAACRFTWVVGALAEGLEAARAWRKFGRGGRGLWRERLHIC